jgi:RNA polymerase sigma-70 factor (ECF subfamily)
MWPSSEETQKLLDRIRQGEAAALDRLLGLYREPLRRMIGLRLDPALAGRLDASDVVQDALLEVSRRLKDYLRDASMPFDLWVRHITKDHIIDAHRRHRKAQRRSLDREQPLVPAGLAEHSSIEMMAQLFDHELTPATAAIQHEMQRKVADAIGRLDEHDREIIVLKLYEQLSNQATAKILGLTEAATSMRFMRAVRRLKALLVPGGSQA